MAHVILFPDQGEAVNRLNPSLLLDMNTRSYLDRLGEKYGRNNVHIRDMTAQRGLVRIHIGGGCIDHSMSSYGSSSLASLAKDVEEYWPFFQGTDYCVDFIVEPNATHTWPTIPEELRFCNDRLFYNGPGGIYGAHLTSVGVQTHLDAFLKIDDEFMKTKEGIRAFNSWITELIDV